MQDNLNIVTQRVLEKITPTEDRRKMMLSLAKDLELKVSNACKKLGISAIVRLEGSLAKDTWLSDDPDVDVFMRLPTSIPRKDLGEIALKIARKATEGSKQIERFAEHPYLEAIIDGDRVNIVPCYDAKPGEWLSATDRTPYHTDFINSNLKEGQRAEVRLLKKFMKGIGVYGAEIKIGGFSGYLCELLVLRFGSFNGVLQAFSDKLSKQVIDLKSFYKNRQRELELLFPEPLVVVDPVDKARNVASAVQPYRLFTFGAASRAFLKNPSMEFFFPVKTEPIAVKDLKEVFSKRGSSVVFIAFKLLDVVPDVLWGQLHRTRKAIRKQLELGDFTVLRDGVWTEDDSQFIMLIFELGQARLSNIRMHYGPPLDFKVECEHFLEKHGSNKDVVAGPFIDDGRWVIMLPRKFVHVSEFLRAKLASGGREIGVADLVSKTMQEEFSVLIGDEAIEYYAYNASFAAWLTDFLSGKPFWLNI